MIKAANRIVVILLIGTRGIGAFGQESAQRNNSSDEHERAQQQSLATGLDVQGYIAVGSPGPAHEKLKPLVGSWKMEGKFRMRPGGEWTKFGATAEVKPLYDGRFFEERITGEVSDQMPKPFQGLRLIGYDNFRQKYDAVWIENYRTSIIVSEGMANDAGDVITLTGTYGDPATGKTRPLKWVLTIADENEHTYQEYDTANSGAEYVAIEIRYTRIKDSKKDSNSDGSDGRN